MNTQLENLWAAAGQLWQSLGDWMLKQSNEVQLSAAVHFGTEYDGLGEVLERLFDEVESVGKEQLIIELDEAERKAWVSLARYKFQMFGYWAAIWIHLNRISGEKRPNPWSELVLRARERV